MLVTFSDINKRIIKLGSKPSARLINMREARLYTNNNTFCKENAINVIRNWESLDENTDTAYNKALDTFEEICNNTNSSIIRSTCNILLEDVTKVRDPSQLMNSLKHRLARLKKKSTSSVRSAADKNTDKIQSNITALKTVKVSGIASPSSSSSASTDSATEECFNLLINKCKLVMECDRIIKNYGTISKRFNLDKLVSDIRYPSDLYEACFEIASCIDTYNTTFKRKYNSALEMTSYVFDKHFMSYPKNKIIESVTDYFIFYGGLKEDTINDVKQIKDSSVLFEASDFNNIDWLFDNNKDSVNENEIQFSDGYGYFNEKGLGNIIKNKSKEIIKAGKDLNKAAKEGNPDDHRDEEVKKMVSDFRASCVKNKDNKLNLTSLKSLITKIFTKTPEQIVYETPNILTIIRIGFIIGVGVIHPILMVCAYLVDGILKIHLSRKQLEKIIKAYKSEIETVNNKIEKTKDEETKKRLEKYVAELQVDLEKITTYEDDVYTDDENDARHEDDDSSSNDDFDFDDDDFDFDNDDFDFEELASIEIISDQMAMLYESISEDSIDDIIYDNIYRLDNDAIDAITDFSITVPTILKKDNLKESLCNYRDSLRKSANNINDYIRIDCLNENIYKINNCSTSYATASTIKDATYYLFCLNEIAKIKSDNYIMENMNFINTIKLSIDQLKRKAVKLSDKEKQVSNSIDVAANTAAKSMEDALMTSNREAVIKGRIIPSASKCIKLALGAGAVAWALSPAIAVIGVLGIFACSKQLQHKERQLILDDIDIELKMCERYLQQAENEGDLKKVRQIEVMQRNLERQKQRIKHRMSMQLTPKNLKKLG